LAASVGDEEAANGFESAIGVNGPDFNGCDRGAGEATGVLFASAAARALRRSFTFLTVGTLGSTCGMGGFGASEDRETGSEGSTGDGCDADEMEAFELGASAFIVWLEETEGETGADLKSTAGAIAFESTVTGFEEIT